MRILLTGSFGNIGESTLLSLLKTEHEIICFDLRNESTEKKMKELSKKGAFETEWGDITDESSVEKAIDGVNCIIHLAALIPPPSEDNPELARKINVDGTRILLDLASHLHSFHRFIFTSSLSTFGPRSPNMPIVTADTPQIATDTYTTTKIECEEIIRDSGLPWLIHRLAAIPPLELNTEFGTYIFEIPFDQKIEFAHTRDIGLAIANSVDIGIDCIVLLLGGGDGCHLTYGEFLNGSLEASGIGHIPREAFRTPIGDDDWYYTSWMDTSQSQELLDFQHRTFKDYCEEMKKITGFKRHLIKLGGSFVVNHLLKQSPYYAEFKESQKSE